MLRRNLHFRPPKSGPMRLDLDGVDDLKQECNHGIGRAPGCEIE